MTADYQWDPKKHVAISVRTSYDVNLRSRGFLYFSPPKGPLAMELDHLGEDIWKKDVGRRLELVIKHELGHVYGHSHGGTSWDLMGEGFPEYVIRTDIETVEETISEYVYQPGHRVAAGLDEIDPYVLADFFSSPYEAGDRFGMTWLNSELSLVRVRPNHPDAKPGFPFREHLGSVDLSRPYRETAVPLTRLYLPEGRAVLKDFEGILDVTAVKTKEYKTTFISSKGGPSRKLFIKHSPSQFELGGIYKDEIFLDLKQLEEIAAMPP